jgi:hypothetical protein
METEMTFMQTFHCKIITIGLLLILPTIAGAQATLERSELGQNAALQYWQAFAQMPVLDAEQEKILDERDTVSMDDPAVEKLVSGSHMSLVYLRRAAKLQQCDWGLAYEDGVSLLLPHLKKARDLARLAALDARYQYAKGNNRALRDNAMGMMALARHVGRDPIMVCILVRVLIEGMVVDLVAPYVPELNAKYADSVAMFEALPSASRVAAALDTEKEFFVKWMLRKLKEEENRKAGAGLVLWKNFIGADAPQELQEIDSLDQVVQLTEDVLPVYDELAELVGLPHGEFITKYPQFKQRVTSRNKLADFIVPDVNNLLEKERGNEARLAMLLAAIAVKEGGPGKLEDIKDPFGDGPFEYRKLDGGFELESDLQVEGKPVTLAVGQREKP